MSHPTTTTLSKSLWVIAVQGIQVRGGFIGGGIRGRESILLALEFPDDESQDGKQERQEGGPHQIAVKVDRDCCSVGGAGGALLAIAARPKTAAMAPMTVVTAVFASMLPVAQAEMA